MPYKRHLEEQLGSHFRKYRQVLILLGHRQVGKTTILKKIFDSAKYLSVDSEEVRKLLESFDINTYKQFLADDKQLILDEIHQISNPGRAIKILYDEYPTLNLIVSGSSSLMIRKKASESLAGRKVEYELYPLTFSEYLTQKGIEDKLNFRIWERLRGEDPLKEIPRLFDLKTVLEQTMLYGFYPELIQLPQDVHYLDSLVDSVIFKDLLILGLIDDVEIARNLLKLLAYQIGNIINYAEIANRLDVDMRLVKRYIEVFEQSFIIFRLFPYAKKGRDEIGKSPKIYFYDLGIRNALIGNYDSFAVRSDVGAMFENFIISEIKKAIRYNNELNCQLHYWRTKAGSEMDLVIDYKGGLTAIEIKTSPRRINSAFQNRYPEAQTKVVTMANFY